MRRALTAAGTLLAAIPLVLTAAGPAGAATGTLTVESTRGPRVRIVNPAAGCHALPAFPLFSRIRVINATDTDVVFYSGAGCRSGLLRATTRVRAGATVRRTMSGTYSVRVEPTWP
ncbi:hypothetical protein Sru01_37660 [Sphaerisporangium rufum]|uniref:Secreted protein n=1 Tax=Sphaerisporangium rufum TaxID=1381558 RepID=A0A919R396_9ACTN|nr:hypothetical protein [Sphaerisporangium rufum]GII78784.1 hypothetical protein Sru01_37660 [Sphaerisporangium rufum]